MASKKKREPKKVPVETVTAYAMVKTGAGMWRAREYQIPVDATPAHETTDRTKAECVAAIESCLITPRGGKAGLPS
jgi:hypothetical protein